MAEPTVIMGGRDEGVEYGPTRDDLKTKAAQANVDPNAYAGQEVHPTHKDKFKAREYQKEYDRAEKIRKDVEKRHEEELEKKVDKERKQRERQQERNRRPRGGIELPKQGIGRISRASEGLSSALLPEHAFDYSDAFSMGGELGSMTGGIRSEMGMPDFSGMINMFGRASRGRGRQSGDGGISTGFGGYQSPFAGMMGTPVKRGKTLSATGSLTGGIFGKRRKSKKIGDIFSLRLF